MKCLWQSTHSVKFWQCTKRPLNILSALSEATFRGVVKSRYKHSQHKQSQKDFTLHQMEGILSSLSYILYTSTELSVHMCCNWLNVPGGSRHLTQWRPLFFLADADSAITAHTITTPHSAQQALELRFCVTRLSTKKKRILTWRNPLWGCFKLSYQKINVCKSFE